MRKNHGWRILAAALMFLASAGCGGSMSENPLPEPAPGDEINLGGVHNQLKDRQGLLTEDQ